MKRSHIIVKVHGTFSMSTYTYLIQLILGHQTDKEIQVRKILASKEIQAVQTTNVSPIKLESGF